MTNFLIAWEDDYWLYLKVWHGSTTNTNILFNPGNKKSLCDLDTKVSRTELIKLLVVALCELCIVQLVPNLTQSCTMVIISCFPHRNV